MRSIAPTLLVIVCIIFDPTFELPNHVTSHSYENPSIHWTNARLYDKEHETRIENNVYDREKSEDSSVYSRLTAHAKEHDKTSIENHVNDREKSEVSRVYPALILHVKENDKTSTEYYVNDREKSEDSSVYPKLTLHIKEHDKTSTENHVNNREKIKYSLVYPGLTLHAKEHDETNVDNVVNDKGKSEDSRVHRTNHRLTLYDIKHVKTSIDRDVNGREHKHLHELNMHQSLTSLHHKEHVKTSRDVKVRRKREMDPCAPFQFKDGAILSNPRDHPYDTTYSRNITCITKITAREEDIIKLTFVDKFKIEDSPKCENDYLEIRDGEFGYSTPAHKYCGDTAPGPYSSTGPHLWLKFHSDDTIEHQGFHIKVDFMTKDNNGELPKRKIPQSCRKEVEGQVYGEIGSHSDDVKECRSESPKELDIQWKIVTPANTSIFLNFTDYKMAMPNDCESNFVQVFGAEPNFDNKLHEYCGSVAKSVTTKPPKEGHGPSNVMYVRLYANILAKGTKFQAEFTAFRSLTGQETCLPEEFDCNDGTCIDGGLACNDIANCRLKQDEDCAGEKQSLLKETRILVMLIIFLIGLSAVSVFFLFTCIRKLYRDHQYIKETLKAKSQEHLEQMCDDHFSFDSDGMDRLSVPDDSPERENLANNSLNINGRKSGSMESDLLQLDSPIDGDNDWPESTPILTDENETKHKNKSRRSDASKNHFKQRVESPKINIDKDEDLNKPKFKNRPRRSDASNRKESLRTGATKEHKLKKIENKESKRRESNKKEELNRRESTKKENSPETKTPKENIKDIEYNDRPKHTKSKNEYSRTNTLREEEPKQMDHKSKPKRKIYKKEESQTKKSQEDLTEIEVKGKLRHETNRKKQLVTPKTSNDEDSKEIEDSERHKDTSKKEEHVQNRKENTNTGTKSRPRDTSKKEESFRTKSKEETKEIRDAAVGTLDTMDFECQTRESLFLTDPITSSDGTSSSNSRGLSVLASSSATIVRPATLAAGITSHVTIDLQATREPSTHGDSRPMSSETTRSAPDVIIVAKPVRLS